MTQREIIERILGGSTEETETSAATTSKVGKDNEALFRSLGIRPDSRRKDIDEDDVFERMIRDSM